VTAGNVNIVTVSPNQLDIVQSSKKAIINWGDFSIGSGETTNFLQPGRNSWTLNRVTGGNPSAILGSLNANGNVLLLNQNGILFGPNSKIDVGGLGRLHGQHQGYGLPQRPLPLRGRPAGQHGHQPGPYHRGRRRAGRAGRARASPIPA
jgi:filamentous hemagglutinin family protein